MPVGQTYRQTHPLIGSNIHLEPIEFFSQEIQMFPSFLQFQANDHHRRVARDRMLDGSYKRGSELENWSKQLNQTIEAKAGIKNRPVEQHQKQQLKHKKTKKQQQPNTKATKNHQKCNKPKQNIKSHNLIKQQKPRNQANKH